MFANNIFVSGKEFAKNLELTGLDIKKFFTRSLEVYAPSFACPRKQGCTYKSGGMPEGGATLHEMVAVEAGVHGCRRAHERERAPGRVHLPPGGGVLDTAGAHGHGLRRRALQLMCVLVLPGHGRGGRAGEPLHEVAELPGLHAVHLGRRRRRR